MANKIIIKKSSVAAKIPLATDLEVGEIAGNLEDQKLYSKKPDGTVVLMGSGLGGSGDVEGPSSATDNAVARYDGTTGTAIQNSDVTIDDSGNLTATTSRSTGTGANRMPVGTTAQRPATPEIGEYRLNSDTGLLEFYNGTFWELSRGGVIATGGTVTDIYENGNIYRVHSFTSLGSSTFDVIAGVGAVEYLLVAGGGDQGFGSGGAGGLLTATLEITPDNYPVVVGDGGVVPPEPPPSNQSSDGASGGNSSVFDLTAIGGGGGGGGAKVNNVSGRPGRSGGSGGGGGRKFGTGTGGAGGAGTPGQGNNGGNGADSTGGGGGGKNSAGGGNQSAGAGLTSFITGTQQVFARGGGNGTTQPANSGNGGGGSSSAGASGIVVIRYKIG